MKNNYLIKIKNLVLTIFFVLVLYFALTSPDSWFSLEKRGGIFGMIVYNGYAILLLFKYGYHIYHFKKQSRYIQITSIIYVAMALLYLGANTAYLVKFYL